MVCPRGLSKNDVKKNNSAITLGSLPKTIYQSRFAPKNKEKNNVQKLGPRPKSVLSRLDVRLLFRAPAGSPEPTAGSPSGWKNKFPFKKFSSGWKNKFPFKKFSKKEYKLS